MNKQEEIREEIKAYLAEAMDGIEFSEEDKKELDVMAGNLLEFLVSRGVVMKADRVLPQYYTSKMPTAVDRDDVECGFFEPLIKEGW